MSGFESSWLTLREPYDHAARSEALTEAFAAALPSPATLTDLATGTGSNLRYLAPRLGNAQDWLLVDHDPALLRAAPPATAAWAGRVGWSVESVPGSPGTTSPGLRVTSAERRIELRWRCCDLSTFEGFEGHELGAVTASALLDLTSAAWLGKLADRCRGAAVLIALSFDGRLTWQPEDADDEAVRLRFLADQRTDKGFGPALGPEACARLAAELDARGHRVRLAPSDWHLGSDDRPLLEATLDGIVAAAGQVDDDRMLARWSEQRRRQLAAGTLRLTLGHQDLLALPQ